MAQLYPEHAAWYCRQSVKRGADLKSPKGWFISETTLVGPWPRRRFTLESTSEPSVPSWCPPHPTKWRLTVIEFKDPVARNFLKRDVLFGEEALKNAWR